DIVGGITGALDAGIDNYGSIKSTRNSYANKIYRYNNSYTRAVEITAVELPKGYYYKDYVLPPGSSKTPQLLWMFEDEEY
ncbi:MAG: hypothetical protein ACRCUS_09510, partial [Anaerovoracaceae bacterium]